VFNVAQTGACHPKKRAPARGAIDRHHIASSLGSDTPVESVSVLIPDFDLPTDRMEHTELRRRDISVRMQHGAVMLT
jgi:hypothetical protein